MGSPDTAARLISQRSQFLVQDLAKYQSLESGIQVAKLYENSKRRLEVGVGKLSRAVETIRAMKDEKIPLAQPTIPVSSLKSAIEQIEQQASASVSEMVQSDELADLIRTVDEAASTLEAHARTAWTEYVEAQAIGGSSAIDLFDDLGLFPKEIEQMRSAVEVIDSVSAYDMPSPNEVERYTAALRTYRHIQSSLAEADLPLHVREFLEAAVDMGAPLKRLDSDVLDWIEEHGLTGSFVVVLD